MNFLFELLKTVEECNHCAVEFVIPKIANTSGGVTVRETNKLTSSIWNSDMSEYRGSSRDLSSNDSKKEWLPYGTILYRLKVKFILLAKECRSRAD